MHPLGPLGVEPAVGLLVLRLEHADRLPVLVLDEVRAGAALVDALGVDAGLDGVLGRPDELRELRVVCTEEGRKRTLVFGMKRGFFRGLG